MGLALHQAEAAIHVVGHDKDADHAGTARRLKAVDKTDWNLIGACEDADIVVLALPLQAIEDTLRALGPHLKAGCIVTDTANLKEQVIGWAEAYLPDTTSFVGGNPLIAGGGSGPDAASPDLFRGNLYCLTPAPAAHPDAVRLVSDMVAMLGGQPYYLDAAEHDGLMAGVEHLPRVVALALVNATAQGASWREMRKLAGGSFEQVSALIGEDPDALSSLFIGNKDNLLRWLDAYLGALREVRELLGQGDGEPLAQYADRAVVARRQWLEDRKDRFSELKPAEVERGSLVRQLFLGGRRRKS
jgi:prephenate dehydrogenase